MMHDTHNPAMEHIRPLSARFSVDTHIHDVEPLNAATLQAIARLEASGFLVSDIAHQMARANATLRTARHRARPHTPSPCPSPLRRMSLNGSEELQGHVAVRVSDLEDMPSTSATPSILRPDTGASLSEPALSPVLPAVGDDLGMKKAATTDTTQEKLSVEGNSGSVRVMVVDDDPMVRSTLTRMLTNMGHKVINQAHDGLAAVETYRANVHDLVLLDMRMPRLDGKDAFIRLKQDHPNIRVVIVSAYCDDEDVRFVLKEGAKGVVRKPFRLSGLRSAIDAAMNPGLADMTFVCDGVHLTTNRRDESDEGSMSASL
ncbi:Response regulator receiver domain [Carpediemonas membranifera]|uniref:Response regulator receiver domain n=1 Tax=Carpediemonas membranifera TaxID=201153 RepID=A0A8J6EAM0_9EUKA|nr:Response regulator receiver domain [Carpediemonas membranifera]|eukprot:KAG9394885.1 Response regulator receiver domain [Carpediemonas membranifera]